MTLRLCLRSAQATAFTVLLVSACSSSATPPAAPPTTGANGQSSAAGSGTTSGGAAGTPAGAAGTLAARGGAAGTGSSNAGRSAVAGTGSAGSSGGAAGAAPAAGSGGSAAPAAGSGGAVAPVGGSAGTAMTAAGTGAAGGAAPGALPAISDFGMMGPFKPATKLRSGPMSAYTLFYPTELGKDGFKHPIITWGNGATSTPDQFTLLPLLASQGYFVIAANDSFVTSAEMKSGIDWAIQENERMGGDFFQKLDATKVASMGWSLGSLGTFEIANDPRMTTTVHISGGAMDKSVVPNLKHPAAFFCGNSSDIAHDNCESDFTMATVPVFYGVFPGDHFGIESSQFAPQINKATATWLRWRLMGDTSVANNFVGPDCTLCKDKSWTVKQKDLDTAPP